MRLKSFAMFEGAGKSLPKELIDRIGKKLGSMEQPKLYWDYNDEIPLSSVQKLIDGHNIFEDSDFDTMDAEYEAEVAHIKAGLEIFADEIKDHLDDDDPDFDELARSLREDLIDTFSVDINLEDLAGNTKVNCRLVWQSNYEGIQSDFDMSSQKYTYDGYFKQMLDILMLNPYKVKAMLGDDASGKFPNIRTRDGKEYVDYKEFIQELRNNTSYGELIFACKLNVKDVINGMPSEMVVPKGNYAGLFSTWVGGGSMLEMKLKRDFKVDLKKNDRFDKFKLFVDEVNKYSIKDVYGMSSDFFGKAISF